MVATRAPRRVPLRFKLAALLVATALVPLSLASCAAEKVQREALLRAEQELEAAAVDDVASGVTRALDDVERRGRMAASILGDGRIEDDALRVSLATQALAEAELVEGARVVDASGASILTLVGGDEPAWPVVARGPDPSWAAVDHPSVRSGVAFRQEPVRARGVLTGYLVMRVDVRGVAESLARVSAVRLGARDRVALIGRDLRVIVPASREGRPAVGGTVAADISQGAFGGTEFVRTLSFRGDGGDAMVGTIRSLPRLRVAAVVERPEAEAFGALVAAKRALMTFAVVMGGMALVVGIWLARRVTRPIQSLVRLTTAYAARSFETKMVERTGDELDDLARALENMAGGLAEGEREIARRIEVETTLGRYLPSEVAASIAAGSQELSLVGQRRAVAVLFADVTGFTAFSERAPPEDVVALLGELFTLLAEVVFRHGGMLDKFVGDSMMAIFGATGESDREARQSSALAAAEDMHRFVDASRPAWKARYGFDVHLAIGIAGGEALVGNIGTPTRIEFTAIGDTVNVASRLEALARPGQTLVAGYVAPDPDELGLRSLGLQPLRGKANAVEIFEVVE